MNLIEKICSSTDTDEYFNSIFSKLEMKYFNKILKSTETIDITPKEYYDLIRYADILCRSEKSKYRQISYTILSLLNEFYKDDEEFKVFAEAILVKLGNFPAKNLINSEDLFVNSEIELERIIKENYQITPDAKYVFTDEQYELFESLKNSNHYSFSGPTSFGKSFIIDEFINYIINIRNGVDNIAILVPTRALISQKREELKSIIENTNYKIVEYPDIPYVYNNNKFIFIFTPERLIAYLGNSNNPNIDYMFIDEAQKIISDTDTRAAMYYHAILIAQRKSIKLYFASPNLPNSDVFLKIFQKTTEESKTIKESPVCQNRFYIDLLKNQFFAVSNVENSKLIEIKSNLNNYNDEMEVDCKVNCVFTEIGKDQKNIVYCNSINDTMNLARKFAETLEKKQNEELDKLIEEIKENIHEDYFLIDCLSKGIAFHFGKLPQSIREKIEQLFRKGDIDYIFCTSTLLEGVNLPAKNIFILSNSISQSKFSDMDFSNLAGRAGRLKHELIGNVICVRYCDKDNSWKGIEIDKVLIQKKEISNITYNLLDGKKNFYKNIGRAIKNEEFTTKSASENQKRIWKNYSNLIIMHANEDNPSILIKKFLEKNNDAKKIISDAQKENSVANSILEQSPEINPKYQNQILKKEENYLFPKEITKANCKAVLECLYENYNWEEEESKGIRPLVKDKNKLKYLSHLMFNWISSKPLKVIIISLLRLYNGRKMIKKEGKFQYFNINNKEQVNQIINDIMGGIDTDLRFKIKNYMTNYYLLMCQKYGKENAGEDWTPYIEYGTTNIKNIEIQKLGISMHLAKFILDNAEEGLKFENNTLIDIDKDRILQMIDKEKYTEEYNEIMKKI